MAKFQFIGSSSASKEGQQVLIEWHKFFGLPSEFIQEFGRYYGIYLWGDVEYEGCKIRRQGCIDRIYIGMCGGGARRKREVKTGGKYKKGSLEARYRSSSYTNFPDAEDVSVFDNGKGVFWRRPKFFGIISEEQRFLIKRAESTIVSLYRSWTRLSTNVEIINKASSHQQVTLTSNAERNEIPFLLQPFS
jgi:hypothetical protein